MLEVVVAYFVDERGWSRAAASWIVGGVIFALGIPSALEGRVFDFINTATSDYMLPAGGLLIAVFAGWSLTHQERQAEIPASDLRRVLYLGWVFLLRFVAPIAVTIILLQSIGLF